MSAHNGVQLEFIEQFRSMLDDMSTDDHECTVSMDEMKVKDGLVFSTKTGCMVGFADLGRVNRNLEQ